MYIKKFLKHYYVMLVPAFLWLIFFSIVPMFGIIMAFEDYNPGLGMLKSPFVGLANFQYMLQISDVRQAIANTVIIAVAKIIGNIIVPLTFAILLNELCLKKIKRPIQTIVYMPHFLSWVILAKIVLNIFGYTGRSIRSLDSLVRIRFSFSESRPCFDRWSSAQISGRASAIIQ